MKNAPLFLKFIVGVLGLVIWASLAFLGKTPIDPLVDFIKLGLGALAAHLFSMKDSLTPAGALRVAPAPDTRVPAPSLQAGFTSVRMIVLLAVLTGFFTLAAMVAGCAAGPQVPTLDLRGFQTQVAKACSVVQPTLVTVQAMSAADPVQAAALGEVVKVNGAVCAGAQNIDVASIATAVNTTIPEAIKVISLLPMDPGVKAETQIGLVAFQVALSAAMAQYGPGVAK